MLENGGLDTPARFDFVALGLDTLRYSTISATPLSAIGLLDHRKVIEI